MITSLAVRGVRGIWHEVTLRFADRAVVIHGGNGTGKSSFARALEWALTGQESTGPSAKESAEQRYRRHVLAEESRVEVAFTDGSRISITPEGEEVEGGAVQYRSSCVRASPFLRRSQVLDFLAGRPVDRFKYLEGYLGLAEADALREELAKRVESRERDASAARTRGQQFASTFVALLPGASPSNSVADLERLLRAEAARLMLPGDHSADSIKTLVERAGELVAGDGLAARRANLVRAKEALTSFVKAAGEAEVRDLDAARAKLTALEEAATDADLVDLLAHAQKHFEAGQQGARCPVCRQAVDRDAAIRELSARLEALAGYRGARLELVRKVSAFRTLWVSFLDVARELRSALGVSSLQEISGVPAPSAAAETLMKAAGLNEAEFTAALVLCQAQPILQWMDAVAEFLVKRVGETLASMPPNEASHAIRTFVDAGTRFVASRDSLLTAEREALEAATLARSLKSVAEAIRRARQDVAKTLMEEIGQTVAKYYAAIHPPESKQEVTASPEIVVQRHGGGTAQIKGRFNGEMVDDPRYVYSDGHLDTVGLCIFLALRRFAADRARSARLLVFDDVITSVDLDHARNFIRLLRDEFGDHQLILLTHNELFARWCSTLSPGMRRVNITGWTLEGGPQIGDYASAIQRLEAAIKTESDPKALSLVMMWLLDEWLLDCRFAFELAVPARRGEQYTLAELWDPFAKRLRQIQVRFGGGLPDLGPLLERLRDVARVRNMKAAHENEFAREFPINVMRDIASAAVELMRALHCFKCDECATPTPSSKEAEVLRCRCDTLRYVREVAKVNAVTAT